MELSIKTGRVWWSGVPGPPVFIVKMSFPTTSLSRRDGASWGSALSSELRARIARSGGFPDGCVQMGPAAHHHLRRWALTILNPVSWIPQSVRQRGSYVLDTPVFHWDVLRGTVLVSCSVSGRGILDCHKVNKRIYVTLVCFYKLDILLLLRMALPFFFNILV